jgi:hypothetical protein
MGHAPIVDLLVVGADAAGFAAAACAARKGASAALIKTGGEPNEEGFALEPPNFVWRLLDLQQYELRFETVEEYASLHHSGPAISTFGDSAKTAEALAAIDPALAHLWPQFAEEAESHAPDPGESRRISARQFLSANAVLDDYFADERLKTHLINALVAPYGLSGDEIGSAEALSSIEGWRRRQTSRRALGDSLKSAAQSANVEIAAGRLQSLEHVDSKFWRAVTDEGKELRSRAVMASSALIGEAAGLRVACGGSPLVRRSGAEAVVKIRYDRRPKLPGKSARARYFTAPDRTAIIRARNSMREGRIPEDAPMAIEIAGKEVVVRAPFCPSRLRENGELRDWTGQDRQILGRQAAAAVERALGAIGVIREIEVAIGPDAAAGLQRRSFVSPPIPAPPPSPDPIGAAAALAIQLSR